METSPRPWSRNGNVILDAKGEPVCFMNNDITNGQLLGNADLIVEASKEQ